ncbi:AMP-binding protein [Sanguibacter sp. 25GB23B1]|uniref:AMP-binding protein n=1 Tax=unclassified Sanguibacter TaxID=2645534 RepID=UPI0032AEC649
MPVARDVLDHARTAPGRVAVALDGEAGDVTYAQLARRVLSTAARLAEGGSGVSGGPVMPGGVVAIVPPGPAAAAAPPSAGARWSQTLVTFLAVDLVGAVPLVCDASWGDRHREDVLAGVRPDHRVFVSAPPARPDRPVSSLPGPARALLASSLAARARPDDLAWAGFTSGSTGRPRAVVRTRGSWTGSFSTVSDLAGVSATSTVLVPGDLATSLYCFGAVHALAAGATLRPAVARRDLGPAALASDVLHVTPAQLEIVLDTLAPSARRRHRTALVGGAGLPDAVRRRAERADVHVVPYYGAAELSFVAFDPDGTGLRPFPGTEIEVRVDGEDSHGTVWVRSPWLASGYLAGADGPLRRSDGWATVGDLADPRAADGPLVLRGRGTGAITVGAATVLPEDVEAVLADAPGVADVVVLGTHHPRWGEVVTAVVVVEAREGAETATSDEDSRLLEELQHRSTVALSPAQRPRRWFVAASLPRTGSADGGKLARAAVAEALPGYRRLRGRAQG